MSAELAGRAALVTGASRGIGLAVARALAGACMRVAMVARGDALDAAAAEVGGTAIRADVSTPEGVQRMLERLGGEAPELVVNAAGAFGLAVLAETDPADFDLQLAVNLRAPFLVTRALLPLMLRRGSGHLVNIGSVAGRVAFAENGAYSASKFGLRGMHQVLLQEVRGTGVRATLVEPSATDTPLWDAIDPDARPGLPSRAAMMRADDVARVVLFAAAQPRHVQIPFVAVEAAS